MGVSRGWPTEWEFRCRLTPHSCWEAVMHNLFRATIAVASLGLIAPTIAAEAVTLVPNSAVTSESPATTYELDRTIKDRRIKDSSGLTRSTFARPLVWTHNDKGDRARIFAVNRDGGTRAKLKLRGARNIDFEDISAGPRHTLWIG